MNYIKISLSYRSWIESLQYYLNIANEFWPKKEISQMNEGWCLCKIFGLFFVLFMVNWVLPESISNYCRMKWQLCNRCQIRNSESDLSMHNTIGYRSYIDSTQHLIKHCKVDYSLHETQKKEISPPKSTYKTSSK